MLRDQFLNEIRVAMKMVDRNIVQIRDVGVTESELAGPEDAQHDGIIGVRGRELRQGVDGVFPTPKPRLDEGQAQANLPFIAARIECPCEAFFLVQAPGARG